MVTTPPRRGIIETMKLRPNPPAILQAQERFARMIEGLVRTVDRIMERPRRKSAKRIPAEQELISKSA